MYKEIFKFHKMIIYLLTQLLWHFWSHYKTWLRIIHMKVYYLTTEEIRRKTWVLFYCHYFRCSYFDSFTTITVFIKSEILTQ